MKLCQLPPHDAAGHVTIHALATSAGKIAKGAVLTHDHAEMLKSDGVGAITCAVADTGDVGENEAASRLAEGLKNAGISASDPSTGRVNFTTSAIGIVRYNRDALKRINAVDEGITLALVQHNQLLAAGDMVATLKIIPFFVAGAAVEAVHAILTETPLMAFHPLTPRKVALIQSRFAHQPQALFEATAQVTESRLKQLGCAFLGHSIVAHDTEALAGAIKSAMRGGAEMVLMAGASAIADRGDVIPLALEEAGGAVDHFGLAVDPGNLLMLGHIEGHIGGDIDGGHIGTVPVIGMPGCARSPRLNGLDWVLHLLLAGIPLDKNELADMAAGGLLMEIASRPLPRKLAPRKAKPARIEGVLLAAGASSRMGGANKLLADWGGVPMIRHIAGAMAESNLDTISVILGHDAEAVAAALAGIEARLLFNPDYRKGQSTSLRTGFDHLNQDTTDLMVVLGDMPLIDGDVINTLIAAHTGAENRASKITLPVVDGRRGNPVIWGEAFFDDMMRITGDTGARPLFEAYPAALNPVVFDDRPHLLLDADTAEALEMMRHKAAKGSKG